MKIQIFDGGTVNEVEISQVSNFGELKNALEAEGVNIDYESKSVVIKPGNITLELNDAVVPFAETLIVFLFPKRTKSGSTLLKKHYINLIKSITVETIEETVNHLFNYETIDNYDYDRRTLIDETIEALVGDTLFQDDKEVDPVVTKLQSEYDKIREQL